MPVDQLRHEMQTIGQYDLVEKVAEGGMGTVYKGRHRVSGDIVAVEGATYATVARNTPDDWLVKVDPATGKATPIGATGVAGIWGLGYWKGKVFGFTSGNEFVLIDVNTGKARHVATGPVNWWGAGVTTLAPTIQ